MQIKQKQSKQIWDWLEKKVYRDRKKVLCFVFKKSNKKKKKIIFSKWKFK